MLIHRANIQHDTYVKSEIVANAYRGKEVNLVFSEILECKNGEA
jgi:hypothetical protein